MSISSISGKPSNSKKGSPKARDSSVRSSPTIHMKQTARYGEGMKNNNTNPKTIKSDNSFGTKKTEETKHNTTDFKKSLPISSS